MKHTISTSPHNYRPTPPTYPPSLSPPQSYDKWVDESSLCLPRGGASGGHTKALRVQAREAFVDLHVNQPPEVLQSLNAYQVRSCVRFFVCVSLTPPHLPLLHPSLLRPPSSLLPPPLLPLLPSPSLFFQYLGLADRACFIEDNCFRPPLTFSDCNTLLGTYYIPPLPHSCPCYDPHPHSPSQTATHC